MAHTTVKGTDELEGDEMDHLVKATEKDVEIQQTRFEDNRPHLRLVKEVELEMHQDEFDELTQLSQEELATKLLRLAVEELKQQAPREKEVEKEVEKPKNVFYEATIELGSKREVDEIMIDILNNVREEFRENYDEVRKDDLFNFTIRVERV